MKTICFSNHGTIDPRLITTLGVNVKTGDSPVGYFGTGLKYAIAVLLRNNCRVEIVSGGKCYHFAVQNDTIRGKSFGFIVMHGSGAKPGETLTQSKKVSAAAISYTIPLGFTTELGKNWTLQHAYRELYCNAFDEPGGKVEVVAMKLPPSSDATTIYVAGEAFEKVHEDRWSFRPNPSRERLFQARQQSTYGSTLDYCPGDEVPETVAILPPAPCTDAANAEVEVYLGESKYLFYRGVAVYKLEHPSIFTYNFLSAQTLTEDRTLASFWGTEYDLCKYIAAHKDEHFLETVLSAPKGTFEQKLNFSPASWVCGDPFYTAVQAVAKEKPLDLNNSAFACLLNAKKDKEADYQPVDLTNAEEYILEAAIAFCEAIGFAVSDFPITIVESTGKDTLGLARHGKSYIAHEVLKQPDLLRLILIEEYVHLRDKVADCTREMQNVLFREIIRLGETVQQLRI